MACRRSIPVDGELFLLRRAVGQIQVDERLIGDAGLVGLGLEIVDGVRVQIDGYLLFQLFCVGVFRAPLKSYSSRISNTSIAKGMILSGFIRRRLSRGDKARVFLPSNTVFDSLKRMAILIL